MSSRYQIRVRGQISERIRRSLAEYSVDAAEVDTALSGSFEDPAELQGFLARLEELGLDIVDLRRLPQPPDR